MLVDSACADGARLPGLCRAKFAARRRRTLIEQIAANAYRNGVQYAVRLDLIKPHVDAVPPAEHDEEPSVEAPLSPQAAAERAQEEAAAEATEVARPVAQ